MLYKRISEYRRRHREMTHFSLHNYQREVRYFIYYFSYGFQDAFFVDGRTLIKLPS